MSKKKWKNSVIVWSLVFVLVFQPVAFEVALYAGESNKQIVATEDSDTQTQDAKAEIDAVDTSNWKIDLNTLEKIGVAIGSFFKKGLKSKIKKAKKELAIARTKFADGKTKVSDAAKGSNESAQDTKSAVGTSRSAKNKEDLSAASSARTTAQSGLLAVGQSLLAVSEILAAVGMVLGVAGKTCSALSAIPYVGAVLGAVGGVLSGVASLLAKISAVIKVAAAAVTASANAAKVSDVDFDKFSREAAEAWKNSGNEYKTEAKATNEDIKNDEAPGSAKEDVVIDQSIEEATTSSEVGGNIVGEPDIPQ